MFVWLGKSCSVDANTGSVACSSITIANQPEPQRKRAEPDILAHLRNWPTSDRPHRQFGPLRLVANFTAGRLHRTAISF